MFIRSFLALLFFICVLVFKSFSQDYFESIYLPDSLVVYDLAVNEQSELFVTAHSVYTNNSWILKSSDNGQTWQTVYEYIFGPAGVIKINPEGTIYALAEYDWQESSLIKSIDNGQTWTYLHVPADNNFSNSGLYFQGDDTLFVAQSNSLKNRLLRTTDEGSNWDTIFTHINSSEFITSLAIKSNTMYLSLSGFFENTGGVYKSNDNGTTWNLMGLFSNMVIDLSFNNTGDLFISTMSGEDPAGLYAIYANDEFISPVFTGPSLTKLTINEGDDIFAGNFYIGSIYHSTDNGVTHDWITSGLPTYASITNLYLDHQQFLYVTAGTNVIWRSTEATITGKREKQSAQCLVFPNPCYDQITGFIPDAQIGELIFKIHDQSGRLVADGLVLINDFRFTLDLFYLPKGIYYLHIYSAQTFAMQIVKL